MKVVKNKPFIKADSNKEIYDLLYPDGFESLTKDTFGKGWQSLLLCGQRGSGKTTLTKEYVSRIDSGSRQYAMHCSAAEIYLAIFVKENDELLKVVGNVSCLVVDDIEFLALQEHGDELLVTLFDKRNSDNLHTIFVSNKTKEELETELPSFDFSLCHFSLIKPLCKEDFAAYAQGMFSYYSPKESSFLSFAAINYICKKSASLKDVDNAVHYLAINQRKSAKGIELDEVQRLLDL